MWDKHFDEDDDFPQRCKEMKKRVNSLRCDAIVSAGLATSRRCVDDCSPVNTANLVYVNIVVQVEMSPYRE